MSEDLRGLAADLVGIPSVTGEEGAAAERFRAFLEDAGFETYTWRADPERLADHPSFPSDPAEIDATRENVAGVLEFGDPGAGPTLVLNGHVDVVPAEASGWTDPPFEATWLDGGARLRGRGAVDMKSGLAACAFAALDLRERDPDLDGRVVVEAVTDEEAGGAGAAQAALSNPYPFERDAAIVAEPTELEVVTATEGTVMKRLRVHGRSAHAATRWHGESVIPRFIAIHEALMDLEAERAESVTHPLYTDVEIPWPVCFGTLEAGVWASSVPAELTAGIRIGVAPGETVAEVEAAFEERLAEVVAADPWMAEHPPDFERFSVQFEPAEIDPGEPVVGALQAAMADAGLADTAPRGATYGADSRHYVAAGIPTVVFGPGSIQQAHFPDETIEWAEVETARTVLADTAERVLRDGVGS